MTQFLYHRSYLDVSGGEVVRLGVEPVDGVDHAGVVHLAEERNLGKEIT